MTTRPPSPAIIWVRRNLFRSFTDGVITIVFGALGLYIAFRLARFVFFTARWEIIRVNLKLLMVGRWPDVHLPRIAVALVVMGAWGGIIGGLVHARQVRAGRGSVDDMSRRERIFDLTRRFGLLIGTVFLLLVLTTTGGTWLMALGLVVAGVAGRVVGSRIGHLQLAGIARLLGMLVMAVIPVILFLYLADAVPLADWEGFYFNVVSATAGIALSFPLGVLLALGRRSKLPLLKGISTVYIELVRGSPLYVLLLLANVSLEFFVPESLAPSKPVRAIVTFTIFTAAYLAEIVRGGLQSVPRGQEEAAKALGLSPVKQTALIVLPQALRNVIPAQIGQFISLFKDTTLAGLGLGILELLGGASAITQQPDFQGQGLIIEALAFVSFVFWVGAFTMSRESQRLERKLGVGTR